MKPFPAYALSLSAFLIYRAAADASAAPLIALPILLFIGAAYLD